MMEEAQPALSYTAKDSRAYSNGVHGVIGAYCRQGKMRQQYRAFLLQAVGVGEGSTYDTTPGCVDALVRLNVFSEQSL